MELDHIFVCVSIGAPEAQRLIEFGLTEGSANVHPGQGTANRRFFFRNAMLELLWIRDQIEAQSQTTWQTHLWERWSSRTIGACPFGFCFRPKTSDDRTLPFPAWEYKPSYLTSPLCMHIGTNSEILAEPMLVYLAFVNGAERRAAFEREPRGHQNGFGEITRMELITPHAAELSAELNAVVESRELEVREGESYALHIGFDGEVQGKTADIQPALPLVFNW